MKRIILLSIVLFGIARELTLEEIRWLYKWRHQYEVLFEEGKRGGDFSYADRLSMPVMAEHPAAYDQLRELAADTIKWRSLEWALNYLKPRSGPAAALPDSLRRELLYYIYRDRLISLDRPWGFYTVDGCCMIDFYIHGGAGSSGDGWIRFVNILLSEEPGFYGFFTVTWAPRGDRKLGPSHSTRMILSAMEEGKLLSYSVNPVWHYDYRLKPCSLYNVPAFKAEIPVEYDYVMMQRFDGDSCLSDTLQVFVLEKGDYEYLISMSSLTSDTWSIISTYEEWLEMFMALSE